jgi:CheY-like chemotaxis protein
MMGLTELILQSDISPENRRYLDLSLQSATHLLHLVDEVLDMSKIQAGGLTLAMAPFSLHQLLEELGALFMARASEKNLTLETRMAAGVPKRLIGDAMRLRQVLANLLGNAIKFTDAGTVALRVEVVSGKQGEGSSSALCRLRFSVVDTGTGISNDQQKAVFKAFTQADGSTARRHGGTGLGLTISAALVEMMGSRIELVSRLGEGSTFSFDLELPVAPEPAASPQDAPIGGKVCESPSQELEKGLDGLRLLLCEDNDVNALVVMRTFEKEGAEVLRVGTGRAGVDAARTRDFDAVIMDLQMPDMDGLEATRRIRAWEQQQGRLPMPILALTANAMPDDRESCIAAGMNAFLTKPIRPATLVEALERATQGPVRSPALRSGVDGPAG